MRTIWEWIALGIVVLTLLAILGLLIVPLFLDFGWIGIAMMVWVILFVIALGTMGL